MDDFKEILLHIIAEIEIIETNRKTDIETICDYTDKLRQTYKSVCSENKEHAKEIADAGGILKKLSEQETTELDNITNALNVLADFYEKILLQ